MDKQDILAWLREADPQRLNQLWLDADRIRRESVGEAVHLRGLIEISNYCCRQCAYCGIHVLNTDVPRYRMTREEIIESARMAAAFGYGTVVMQAGEDAGITAEWMAEIVRTIRYDIGLAVTLSLGERTEEEFRLWHEAGANRYLIRFETSDATLYRRIHPSLPGTVSDRFAILKKLQSLGYETGSGVMVGIPGQSYDTLADDLLWFVTLGLDMIGIGPWIPHPDTALARKPDQFPTAGTEQVPNTAEMLFKVLALARVLCPAANIPSTTAIATIAGKEGRGNGLMRGANIVMPNVTPLCYRQMYAIYPGKASSLETPEETNRIICEHIRSLGRTIGIGPGDSPSFRQRQTAIS